jgi:REP element-mobilizing transposase RayT
MARPLRVQFPGGLYHVSARGNEQKLIFADDVDCVSFLRVLASAVERYHVLCHAYCLMNNHYHLLLETPDSLSHAMRQLNGVYSQRFNRRHGRTGHLFGGRFHAVVVHRDAHLREVSRYIVLNPVRAGLVDDPAAWRWSSYLATVGEALVPSFLTTEWLLGLSGMTERAGAQHAYGKFVRRGLDEMPEVPTRLDSGFGAPRPKVGLRPGFKAGGRLGEIPRAQRFASRPPLSELFSGVVSRAERNVRCVAAIRRSAIR